jgi:hypothetical protein
MVTQDFSGSVTDATDGNALGLSIGDTVTGNTTYDNTLITGSGYEEIGLGISGSGTGGTLTMYMGTVSFVHTEDISFYDDVYPILLFWDGELYGFSFWVDGVSKPSLPFPNDEFTVSGSEWNYLSSESFSLSAKGDWTTFSTPEVIPEPSTVLLFAVGGILTISLVGYHRRRKQR